MSEKIATREAYGKALVELGASNDKIVVLDADLAGATMTKFFKAAYPDRFFDCGIAECNMMDVAAGLSTMGLIPFCSTFAMFGAGRAYEQIRNSIAYPRFNVKICCSHAGVSVGEDGGSHQSIEDIGLMRMIPGMTVIVPADGNEARKATFALAQMEGPAYLRTARLASPVFEQDYPFEIGKANVLREGKDAAVFACGLMVSRRGHSYLCHQRSHHQTHRRRLRHEVRTEVRQRGDGGGTQRHRRSGRCRGGRPHGQGEL